MKKPYFVKDIIRTKIKKNFNHFLSIKNRLKQYRLGAIHLIDLVTP